MSTSSKVQVGPVRALGQHNVHAYLPVLELTIDIGPYEESSSADVPGCVERLLAWVPELAEHECSVGRRGGFVERLTRGTWFAHIVEHVTIALQNRMGFRVSFGRARGTGTRGVYRVVIEYQDEIPARAALETAVRIVTAAMEATPFDSEGESERLLEIADEHRVGPSTAAILDAARDCGIPCLRITPRRGLFQLGYGVHQRLIQASQTSLTSAIAVDVCQEKELTNAILRDVGVPVPEGRTARSAEDAWVLAQQIGLPVAVKPESGNQGRGVSVGLRTREQVEEAWSLAAASRRGGVLVERSIAGGDYRLLVVGGKMVAAARRDPPQVLGDGVSTVEQLVAEANRDPRRRPGHGSVLTRIALDEAADLALAQQKLQRSSVPAPGTAVVLRTNGNLSTGGTATDVTDRVHPRNVRMAELAADILGLDIAGVDVVVEDISQPLADQGGAVIEVNAAPGLRMHLAPAVGLSRDVGRPIVRTLFPPGTPSRIPIVAITGTNGKTTVTVLTSHLFATARKTVGTTTTEGVYIGGERIVTGDCSGPRSARTVLRHPRVEVAVLETARGGILREGLAYDACDVAVVTNVTADHLGLHGVDTLEDLARVKQVVVQAVRRGGTSVLNAEDPLAAGMAAVSRGRVVYFSTRADHPVLRVHLEAGGSAVYVDDGAVVLHDADRQQRIVDLARVGFTAGGRIPFQVANALAATAAAWAGGVNPALLARGLSTFVNDTTTVPGRFNRLDVRGVEVIVDYAHNQAAMAALATAVEGLEKRRTLIVVGLPGDRRDEDLAGTIAATVPFADEWILHDLRDRRGRAANEVPRLLADRLPEGSRWQVLPDPRVAFTVAMAAVDEGDRLVLIADEVDPLLEWLAEHGSGIEGCTPLVDQRSYG